MCVRINEQLYKKIHVFLPIWILLELSDAELSKIQIFEKNIIKSKINMYGNLKWI